MWRSEERLEFWLTDASPSNAPHRFAWMEKLGLRRLASEVNALPLGIDTGVDSYDDALVAWATVHDALETFWPSAPGSTCSKGATETALPGSFVATWATHSVDLLGKAVVRRLSIPAPERTRVRQERCAIQVSVRSADVGIKYAIEALALALIRNATVQDCAGLLVQDPVVRATARVSELPQRRKSADIGEFGDEDKNSYLREAEILRRVPPKRAELMAVFHHVPIELISRLRFLAETQEIRFSIMNEPKRTQTRVHDMAVIRDTESQEIHLVPHRTKYRMVSLT
jgi:hypothetical protein